MIKILHFSKSLLSTVYEFLATSPTTIGAICALINICTC